MKCSLSFKHLSNKTMTLACIILVVSLGIALLVKPGVVMKKALIALDFDHTIIDDNSDTYLVKLAPGGAVPPELKNLYSNHGWTKYMAAIFEYLHKNGVTASDYQNCMEEIPLTDGMEALLNSTESDDTEAIIISDSNSILIDFILEHLNLKQRVSRVFTNPARFDEDGCLRIEPYHMQDWCEHSTINLCKGDILVKYLDERRNDGISFDNVLYVGDGKNDYCPSLTLRPQDYCFPRKDFTLFKMIEKMEKEVPGNCPIKAEIIPWQSGHEILKVLKSLHK